MNKMRNLRSKPSGGFSLIEVMVASFLMLMVIVGIVPIFLRSTVSNQTAYNSTRAASFARSEMENYYQAPFDDPSATPVMDVPATGSELVTDLYYDKVDEVWYTGPPPTTASYEWTKKVTVRQFHISAIDNGVLDDSEALDGSAHEGNVHLKQVLVEVRRGSTSSVMGPEREITLNTIRSN